MKAIIVALSLLFASAVAINEHQDGAIDTQINSINNHAYADPQVEVDLDTDEFQEPDLHNRRAQNGPNAGKRMATWRRVHNEPRRKYHVKYGGEFQSIKFNMQLKKEAEVFAKKLVSNCVNRAPKAGENPHNYGVNSAMRMGTRAFQSPVAIMKSWERKLPLGYPKNGVMTQVLWAKTQYVGCADASSPLKSDKTCTASVCFYSKAGNCAFGRFDNYTQAVINGPACSTECPPNIVDGC